MQVYLIEAGFYEDRTIVGVRSSKEEAERFVELHRYSDTTDSYGRHDNALGDGIDIVGWEVDSGPDPSLWRVTICKPTRREPDPKPIVDVADEPLPCQFTRGHEYRAIVQARNAMEARDIGLVLYSGWRSTKAKWPEENDNVVRPI